MSDEVRVVVVNATAAETLGGSAIDPRMEAVAARRRAARATLTGTGQYQELTGRGRSWASACLIFSRITDTPLAGEGYALQVSKSRPGARERKPMIALGNSQSSLPMQMGWQELPAGEPKR